GQFHMPVLAIKLSGSVNGVSRIHGEVSRRLWSDLWPGRDPEQVPIRHVTNGVHLATWMSHHVYALLTSHLGPDWLQRIDEPGFWQAVYTLDDAALWDAHFNLKVVLLRSIRELARRRWVEQWKAESQHLVGAGTLLDERALTIGFARRFATYKRADLILADIEKLTSMVNDPKRPLQFIFAGKAHPRDEPGKKMLQQIAKLMRHLEFADKFVFVEDYDINVGRHFVQGVDVWLNNPRRPLEASGTSGQKVVLNGGLNLSVLDGWWAEAYDGLNGFAIGTGRTHTNMSIHDNRDGEDLYRVLREEVIPLYYQRDHDGLPRGWIKRMKRTIRTLGWRFNANRMVMDYTLKCYVPAAGGMSSDLSKKL
ncbi:MAG: alpha-glucan family phosphorylase, partial [Terriglobales bacterium]